jgi:hypothetical protein
MGAMRILIRGKTSKAKPTFFNTAQICETDVMQLMSSIRLIMDCALCPRPLTKVSHFYPAESNIFVTALLRHYSMSFPAVQFNNKKARSEHKGTQYKSGPMYCFVKRRCSSCNRNKVLAVDKSMKQQKIKIEISRFRRIDGKSPHLTG